MNMLLVKYGLGHKAQLPETIGHWKLARSWETKDSTKGRYNSQCVTEEEYHKRRHEARPVIVSLKESGWYVD